jgi:hypothetical protein
MGWILKAENKGSSLNGVVMRCLVLGLVLVAQGCVTVPKDTDPKYARLKLLHVEEMTAGEFSYFLDKSKNSMSGDSWRWKKAMDDAMRWGVNSSQTSFKNIPENHLVSYEQEVLGSLSSTSGSYSGDDIDLFTMYFINNDSLENRDERLLKVYYKMFSPPAGPIRFIYSKEVYQSALMVLNQETSIKGAEYSEKLDRIFEATYQYLRLFADNIRGNKMSLSKREMNILESYRTKVVKHYYQNKKSRHFLNAKEITRKLDSGAYKDLYLN